MTALLTEWNLEIHVDDILRSQGADPAVLRARSPRVVEAAERALIAGVPLIEPVIACRTLKVRKISHEKVVLDKEGYLTGKLVSNQLAGAREAVIMIGTLGRALESYAAAVLPVDGPLGLALDSLGTAAIDILIKAACAHFAEKAEAHGYETTIPLSPGMEGWDFATGQKQIFQLVDPEEAGIYVTAGGMMVPQKSLTAVIGTGEYVSTGGRACDYCAIRNSCRYQDQYAG
jgi:5-methyltetrahydrofolate--homocysteine methyltransferase